MAASQAPPPEAAETVAEIQQLRGEGKTLMAWKLVQEAIERFGDIEPLDGLRRLIADDLLD